MISGIVVLITVKITGNSRADRQVYQSAYRNYGHTNNIIN